MRRVLAFHRDHCLACRSCELACSVAHSESGVLESALAEEFPPRRRVVLASGSDGVEALRCGPWLEPLCAFAGKSGALRRDPATGRVTLDDARCVACYMCLTVCPFGIRPDPARDRVVRCDVCFGRATPACVEACPTGALSAGTPPDERVRSDFRGHVVVVGSSAAGIAACEAAREHAPGCSITLVTADTSPYSRPLLSYALAGRLEPQQIDWRAEGYLEHELGVHLLTGRKAVRLESDLGALMLDNGEELGFERLILATGARAAALAIRGADLPGVFVLRNFEDFEAISNYVAQALVPAVSRLRTPDLVEPGVSSLSTGQWYAHRRPGDSGKHFCPASAYVPLNERCCKMLRRLIRELFPAITTVTIGRCEEWVSLSSSTARSSGATSGVRRPVSTHLGGRRQA